MKSWSLDHKVSLCGAATSGLMRPSGFGSAFYVKSDELRGSTHTSTYSQQSPYACCFCRLSSGQAFHSPFASRDIQSCAYDAFSKMEMLLLRTKYLMTSAAPPSCAHPSIASVLCNFTAT